MSTIADYLGRKADILAFQPNKNNTQLNQAIANDFTGGNLCTGVQKLAQRWVLEFLTPSGSIPYKTKRGCSFINNFRSGLLRSSLDISSFFASAATDVSVNLKAEDSTTDPDDERFDKAELTDFSTTSGGVLTLSVTITSLAGSSRVVILPINVASGII
jgi:hypothetical protein